jgi:parallel beta-helix repeat protein
VTRAVGSIIRVPNDFPTIQEAINAAQNGSTILVDSGVYYEHVTINKTLTLLGTDKEDTIIDGSNNGTIITVTADNVLINEFTVRNSSTDINADGILLENSSGSTISGNTVALCGGDGIELDDSTNDTVSDNIVSSIGNKVGILWGDGISLGSSQNNTISHNLLTDSAWAGVNLLSSDDNIISGNTIQNNNYGIIEALCDGNVHFSNDFLHNLVQEEVNTSTVNSTGIWSVDGRGNYWDDYTGLDDGSGGRVAGDGVGDTNLPWQGVDYFPLINPVNPLPVFWDNTVFPVSLVSNSTVSAVNFDQADREVTFNLNGPANTTGYFNLSTPAAMLSGPWKVLLNGMDVTTEAMITENQTYTSIYLNYSYSANSVQIIGTTVTSEYPTAIFLPLLTLSALPFLTVLATKKRKKNKQT